MAIMQQSILYIYIMFRKDGKKKDHRKIFLRLAVLFSAKRKRTREREIRNEKFTIRKT